MTLTVRYKDDHVEIYYDVFPKFFFDDTDRGVNELELVDSKEECQGAVPVSIVKQLTWEND